MHFDYTVLLQVIVADIKYRKKMSATQMTISSEDSLFLGSCNGSEAELGTRDGSTTTTKFKANLVYRINSRPARKI